MSRLGPLKYLFSVIWRLTTWASSSVPVEEVKAADTNMLVGRRWVTGKKRLSRLARFVFSMTPYRLQQMLGFPVPSSLGQGEIADELRSSPNKPYGKGSKRKQDDLADEELCWVESLACDLPEDDDSVEDPTYEPSKYYTDSEEVSEEHRECNDTETDLEVEETGDPGLLRLKETPHHEQNENDVPCIDSNERINS
ncbi:oogenesis-related isoform X3 [Rhincodon typus]|nr:oogenesis-related isoform X3 [Rhincodon typus]